MILYSFVFILFAIPVHINADPSTRITTGLSEYIRTGIVPKDLYDAVSALHNLSNKAYKNAQTCQTCNYVVDGVIQYRRSGISRDLMIKLIKELCVIFSDWGEEGCAGTTNIDIDTILYIIDNRSNLTAARVCSIYLQNYLCQDPDMPDWNVDIPVKRNYIEQSVTYGTANDVLKVLHLTDIHFDPDYVPGSNAVCDRPLCCQKGTPQKAENAAGYWGDYHVCDMPWHSVLDLMNQITKQHAEIDYVYYTGDIVSHASWMTTWQKNLKDVKQLFDLFIRTFNSIPVYPVLGNHESHPCNFFSPPNITSKVGTKQLYDLVSDEWSKWLPQDTKQTVSQGGYYTILVKKGFRIIALNSNVCYTGNLWLIYDDVDPYGELKWLINVLLEAEKNGEAVHILSHVPPGHIFCWRKWNNQFNRIVERFSKTIVAQFNGHTHLDEIRIFVDDSSSKAINVAYNGGSFTTFVGMNPNYRMYDVDKKTYQVIDYDNWIYNLTEANKNKNNPPNWYKLYSFKEAYGLNSTDMEDLYDLLQRMKDDPQKTLMKQYFKFQVRESVVNTAKGCDDACLNTLLCYITKIDFEDVVNC